MERSASARQQRNYCGRSSANRHRRPAHAVSVYCNAAKAIAIECAREHNPRAATILDAACGRLGDFLKWNQTMKHLRVLHAFDAEPMQVSEASRRLRGGRVTFGSDLFVADFNEPRDLRQWHARLRGSCDVVACFFALHYADDLHRTVQHLVECVKPGGMLLLTVLDEEALRKPLAGELCVWANGLVRVAFDADDRMRYRFTLDGALQDSDERVVPTEALDHALRIAGCDAVQRRTIPDMLRGSSPGHEAVRRGTVNRLRQPLTVAEREVVDLFRVVLATVPPNGGDVSTAQLASARDMPATPTAVSASEEKAF